MFINFKKADPFANFPTPFDYFCSADEGGESDDGGGGGSGAVDNQSGDDGDDGGDGKGKQDQQAASGLMADAATGGDADGDAGDNDSGQTIEFKNDKGSEKINVPEKYWDKEGGKLNEGAVLKAALDQEKTVRTLQNDLAEAKKNPGKADDGKALETVEAYLENSSDDDDNPFIKDGLIQLGKDQANVKTSPVSIDDPVIKMFAEVAKEEGFSKDQFERIIQRVLAGVEDKADDPIDVEAEAQKFGINAKAVATANKTWADNMKENGELSDVEHIHLLNMGQDAVGLSVVNKLRMQTGGRNIPVNIGGVSGEVPSKEEWMANKPDHRTDPIAYGKWQEDGKVIFGTAPAGSSQSGLGIPQSSGGSKSSYEGKKDVGRQSKSRV